MHTITYQKSNHRDAWKELPNANFYTLQDAVTLAEQLQKVVYRVLVIDEKGRTEYDAWGGQYIDN